MANERFYQGVYFDNLGVKLDSGTFSICGADGRDLSSKNPAYVVTPSKSNPGLFKKNKITANQSFNDASSASGSDIVGNLFGTPTGEAVTDDMTFHGFIVLNDSENGVQIMISRLSGIKTSPATTEIGTPSNAIADEEFSFFSFDDVTVSEYDGNPCVNICSFFMRKNASDDWTVQSLVQQTGIAQTKYSEGDILVANAFGGLDRLPKGINGQVLKAGASTIAWGSDGGSENLPSLPVVDAFFDNFGAGVSSSLSVGISSAPEGTRFILSTGFADNTDTVSSVSCTNVTFTKLVENTSPCSSLWLGVVSGGSSGTSINVTFSDGVFGRYVLVAFIQDDLTGTLLNSDSGSKRNMLLNGNEGKLFFGGSSNIPGGQTNERIFSTCTSNCHSFYNSLGCLYLGYVSKGGTITVGSFCPENTTGRSCGMAIAVIE